MREITKLEKKVIQLDKTSEELIEQQRGKQLGRIFTPSIEGHEEFGLKVRKETLFVNAGRGQRQTLGGGVSFVELEIDLPRQRAPFS